MLTDRLAVILKSTMVLAGCLGFLMGFAASNWRLGKIITALGSADLFRAVDVFLSAFTTDFSNAFIRGVIVCLFAALSVRFLLLRLFREHVLEIKRRKEEAENKKAVEKPK